jgi:hypothetical protein
MNAPQIQDLLATVRAAHADILKASHTSIEKALIIGDIFVDIDDKKIIAHGQKRDFYRQAGVPTRQVQKYKRLARFAAKTTSKSFLSCASIEEAIRILSPPRPKRATAGAPSQGSAGKPDEKFSKVLRHLVDRANAPGADHEALAAARQVATLLMAKGFGADTDIAISITPRADMERKARARAA